MAMRRAAALATLRRLAACQSRSFASLTRSVAPEQTQAGLLNAAKASLAAPSRGFAAEPAPAAAPGTSKGYVKSVSFCASVNLGVQGHREIKHRLAESISPEI